MKTILFDYQIFQEQEYGGISRFYSEIIPRLQVYENCILGIKRSNNIHLKNSKIAPNLKPLKEKELGIIASANYPGKRTINQLLNPIYKNQLYSIKLIQKKDFDIFEPTYYDTYFLNHIGNKPFMLEIHDMIPELYPMYYNSCNDYQIRNKKVLCPLAAHIRVPSENTKKDLVNLLNINPDKISVIPHGISRLSITNTDSITQYPYILFVGGRGKYKNFNALLKELAIILQYEKQLHLVCTGVPFSQNEKQLIADSNLTNSVHHIFASEDNLYSLYKNAVAFVFPSEYEGFGFPILEAWSCECPVFLNYSSCFPEIADDAAVFFDINRQGDLADKLIWFIRSSQDNKHKLINKGIDRLKLYSWDKTAEKMAELYNKF